MSAFFSAHRTRILAFAVSTTLGVLAVEWGLRFVYPYLPSVSALHGSDFRLERLVDLAEDPDLSVCHEVRTFCRIAHDGWVPVRPRVSTLRSWVPSTLREMAPPSDSVRFTAFT